jgi:hypothetical protein
MDTLAARVLAFRPGRALVNLIGAFLFALGWLPTRTLRLTIQAAVWCYAAVVQGGSEGWTVRTDEGP